MDIKEEYRLIRRAKRNDQAAWKALIEQHERFVYKAAMRTTARGLEREDLRQIGWAAFVKCVQDFDISMGRRLSTYAYRIIQQKMYQAAQQHGMIFLPHGAMKTSPEHVHFAYNTLDSLDRLVGEDQRPRGDFLADDHDFMEDIDRKIICDRVFNSVRKLPPRERSVIRRRMAGHTLRAISLDMNICRERVRQIESSARARLKKNLGRKPRRNPAA